MSTLTLTDAEKKFISDARQGKPTDFTKPENQSFTTETENPPSIKAKVIARLLKGLPLATDQTNEPVAIDLKGARITGELNLEYFTGSPRGSVGLPLSLKGCIIEVPLRLSHSHLHSLSLEGSNINHLEAKGIHIDSDLNLSHIESTPGNKDGVDSMGRCHVELQNSKIGGDLLAEEAKFCVRPMTQDEKSPDKPKPHALDLSNTEIGGSLSLMPLVNANGGIKLKNATVKGDIWATGAELRAQNDGDALNGQALCLGGSLMLEGLKASTNQTSFLEQQGKYRGVWLLHAEIGGEIYLEGANIQASESSYALILDNARIGMGVSLSSVHLKGIVSMMNAQVGSNLILEIETITTLSASNLTVNGDVTISGRYQQLEGTGAALSFDGGDFRRNFKIDKLYLVQRDGQHIIPRLSLGDARIEGSLQLYNGNLKHPDLLSDIVCTELSFYPDWILVEPEWQYMNEKTMQAYLQHRNEDRQVLLTGESNPIHTLNESDLKLVDKDVALNYIKFFCAFVWGDEGAFQIIDAVAELDGATLADKNGWALDPDSLVIKSTVNGNENGPWTCVATVRYGDALYKSNFRLGKDGGIEMTNDEYLAEIKGGPQIAFGHSRRILNGSNANLDFWKPRGKIGNQIDPPAKSRVFDALQRLGLVKHKAMISLKRLKAGNFDYRPITTGCNTRDSRPYLKELNEFIYTHNKEFLNFNLDGFEYDSIGVNDFPSDSTKLDATKGNSYDGEPKEEHNRKLSLFSQSFDKAEKKTPRSKPRVQDKITTIEVEEYEKLLLLQYPEQEPTASDYKPQPYEQLGRILRLNGDYAIARKIMLTKLRLDRRFKTYSIFEIFVKPIAGFISRFLSDESALVKSLSKVMDKRVPKLRLELLINPLLEHVIEPLSKPLLLVLDYCFSFGLYAGRPFISFVVIFFVAAGVFANLNDAGRIEPNVIPVTIDGLSSEQYKIALSAVPTSPDKPMPAAANKKEDKDKFDPYLFALDVMVPMLDLGQEAKWTVSDKTGIWYPRLQAFFDVLGAFLSAMFVLSLSGIIRRNVEK